MKGDLGQGTVVRSFSNVHLVLPEGRAWGEPLLSCQVRGKLRLSKTRIYTGDRVTFQVDGDGEGRIEEILPRRTLLLRPPVANVGQAVLVLTASEPPLSRLLLDRLLVLTAAAGVEPLICLNKLDLADADFSIYEQVGYPVVKVSAGDGRGLEALGKRLEGKISVLAGPSGVGKSSLLNALGPGSNLPTGRLSAKLPRGRHTTRWVELLAVAGGLVADSPGFSALDTGDVIRKDLAGYFPELDPEKIGPCRFVGCAHRQEPGCVVREGIGEIIAPDRYRHYLLFLDECKEDRPWLK